MTARPILPPPAPGGQPLSPARCPKTAQAGLAPERFHRLRTAGKAPGVLKAFAESYQQERERLASDKRRRRGELESKLEKTKRQLDRAWSGCEAERLPTEIIGARMRELLARQKKIEIELAEVPGEDKGVGLHPAALRQYERHVGQLDKVFGAGVTENNAEAAQRRESALDTKHPKKSSMKKTLHFNRESTPP